MGFWDGSMRSGNGGVTVTKLIAIIQNLLKESIPSEFPFVWSYGILSFIEIL